MSNHFHILLKQLTENGISRFLSDLQNAYTRYFNIKQEKRGPLFSLQFKSVHIETDEQFVHVARYIHLNPYSSYVVKMIDDLFNYQWSSLREYLPNYNQLEIPIISQIKDIMSFYNYKPKEFIADLLDQSDYQRELEKIKHLILDN